MGLYAYSRGAEERRTSRGPLHDRADPQGARPATGATAADLVADVPAVALGRDRRRRFLHDGSVDVAGPGHVLHGLRDRSGFAPRPDRRFNAASVRAVHAPSVPDADGGG